MYEPFDAEAVVDFGKYRGQLWAEVPLDYIGWLLRQPGLPSYRQEAARMECKRRARCPAIPSAQAIISAGYRVLAAKVHPDMGGTNEAMRNLNLAAEWLRKVVGGAALTRKEKP